MAIREKRNSRDFGMVFKPNFMRFKSEKINLI